MTDTLHDMTLTLDEEVEINRTQQNPEPGRIIWQKFNETEGLIFDYKRR